MADVQTEPAPDSWLHRATALFPGILPADEYVARTATAARRAGFSSGETLPLVATCRDELMVGFTEMVDRAWGPHFAIGSLGGLILAGVSGISAAVGHAPDRGERRFAVYCMTHIGVDADGTLGVVRRPGQAEGSPACGALIEFLAELRSGALRLEYDRTDPEMSLLRTRLAPGVLRGGVPDLLTLTAMARDVALADITEIGGMTGRGKGFVAMFTGIVVHGPYGQDYVVPHLSEVRWPRDSGRAADPLSW
jgi:hypothetical protein